MVLEALAAGYSLYFPLFGTSDSDGKEGKGNGRSRTEAFEIWSKKHGVAIIVPSVQELARQPITKIPPRYVRHEDEESKFESALQFPLVPVINLQSLLTGKSIDSELEKLHLACKEWGFFQVVDHGVSASLLESLKSNIIDLFNLAFEEKKTLWQQPDNHEGFGELFVVSDDQKLDWSDMFYITTLPTCLRKQELFEKLPVKLRQVMEAYSQVIRDLAMTQLAQMAIALKMDAGEMKGLFSDGVQSMRINYYPPCPEPDKAMGFTPHSDADALTILFQMNEIEGLQIHKNGKWLPVKPLKNAFIVNVGDIMEIVSNGRYRSVEHRAKVNPQNERLSIATFYSCNMNSLLAPAKSLIGPQNPAVFRSVPIDKYFKEFFAQKLNGKSYLHFMKIEGIEDGCLM